MSLNVTKGKNVRVILILILTISHLKAVGDEIPEQPKTFFCHMQKRFLHSSPHSSGERQENTNANRYTRFTKLKGDIQPWFQKAVINFKTYSRHPKMIPYLIGGIVACVIFYDEKEKRSLLLTKEKAYREWQEEYKPLCMESIRTASFYQLRSNLFSVQEEEKYSHLRSLRDQINHVLLTSIQQRLSQHNEFTLFNRELKKTLQQDLKDYQEALSIAHGFVYAATFMSLCNLPEADNQLTDAMSGLKAIRTSGISEKEQQRFMVMAANMKSVTQYQATSRDTNPDTYKNNLTEIIKNLEDVVEKYDPLNSIAHLHLGYLKLKRSKIEEDKGRKEDLEKEAEIHINKSRAGDKELTAAAIFDMQGLYYMAKKDYPQALLKFNLALECDPQHPVFLNNRAKLLIKMGKTTPSLYEKAYVDAEGALGIFMEHEHWHKYCRSLPQYISACAYTGRCDMARSYFQEIIPSSPCRVHLGERKVKKVESIIIEKCNKPSTSL